MAPTPIQGLDLVRGALAESPHLKHFQKLKLLRQLASLGVDFVLLDLAAGASSNTLDFFLTADEGILVLVPEPTSIENVFHFVKAAFYRRLRAAAKEERVLEAVDEVLRDRRERGIKSPRRLLPMLRRREPLAADLLVREAADFEPGLVLNQLQESDERGLGPSITRTGRDSFGLRLRLLGTIDHDPAVRQALRSRQPSFTLFPHGPLAQGVRRVTEELLVQTREPDPLETVDEEYRLLGVCPGCRLVDVISAHKRVSARYSGSSLATQAALDDDERRAMIRRLDLACKRIIRGYALGMPPEPDTASSTLLN